jgi:hypothetical protein
MIFDNEEKDWKDFLSRDAQQILSELFENTRDYKGAYMQAEDVKVAQLWCALIEVMKECADVKRQLEMLKGPFRGIVEVGEAEKKKAIERIVRDVVKPMDEDSEEATRKLVESLMKF